MFIPEYFHFILFSIFYFSEILSVKGVSSRILVKLLFEATQPEVENVYNNSKGTGNLAMC